MRARLEELWSVLSSSPEVGESSQAVAHVADWPDGERELALQLLLGPDPKGAIVRATRLPDSILAAPASEPRARLLHEGSYAARLMMLEPQAARALESGIRPAPSRAALLDELRVHAQRDGVEAAFRAIRTREYLRFGYLEATGSPLEEVTEKLSGLADACIQVALESEGLADRVAVLGMGKLAGNELNYLSDVDLIFVHHDDLLPLDDDNAAHRARNRLFSSLRSVIRLLEGTGPYKPLFRIDLRLRPFGSRGPLAMSLRGTEAYYERHGRAWERQVWIRSRTVAGDTEVGETLRRRLLPFVYRRSVGPEVFEEVAAMMQRARRPNGLAPLSSSVVDVKHDAGGIREIEFFVQALQLLHGGRAPSLRTPSTLRGLDRLAAEGLVSDREHEVLTRAYRSLRRIEHRVQLAHGQQTHRLPDDDDERELLAARLAWTDPVGTPGPRMAASAATLLASIRELRQEVVEVTRSLLGEDPKSDLAPADDRRAWARSVISDPAPASRVAALAELGVRDPDEVDALIDHLYGRRDGPLTGPPSIRKGALELLLACLDSPDPDGAVRRLVEFVRARPAHYAVWRVLGRDDHQDLVRRIADLLGTSEPLSRGLVGFPSASGIKDDGVLGLLMETRALELPDRAELIALFGRLGPPTTSLDAQLLRFRHRELVRIGVFDLAHRPDALQVGESLSDLADVIVERLLLDEARADPAKPDLGFTIVAVGKWGMRSMDYGSDLDLMFVFDGGPDPRLALPRATSRARSLIARLQDRSLGSRLYEVDTRLRPSGGQGLLVSSVEGFRRYHARRLPVWERIALLRTRVVESEALRPNSVATALRDEILPAAFIDPADRAQVATEVRKLKLRVEREQARETRDSYDPKGGLGGVFELELLVGALQLIAGSDGGRPPVPIVDAIEELVRRQKLDAADAHDLMAAYGFQRRLLNRLRMSHGSSVISEPDRLTPNSPRMTSLARRMGLEDRDTLVTSYLEHRSVVRAAFDRYLA